MTFKINRERTEYYLRNAYLPHITQLSKTHTKAHTDWVDTKNKIIDQMRLLLADSSPANQTEFGRLSAQGLLADTTKKTIQIDIHQQLEEWVNRYVYRLNGSLQQLCEAFPSRQEQVQFLRQVAAFRAGSDPTAISQSSLDPFTLEPNSLVSIQTTPLPSIPEDANESLYDEPKLAISSPEKHVAANALVAIKIATASVNEKKQAKRRRLSEP